MNKYIKLRVQIGLIAILFTISLFSVENLSKTNIINEILSVNKKEDKYKSAGSWNLTESEIYIDDLDLNYNWSKTAAENDWCSGSGTWNDPYIIENVTIDSKGTSDCIEIANSNVPFIIRNCTLINSAEQGKGIYLRHTDNGKITNNTCSFNYYGILLSICDNNTILGNSLNSNSYSGIFLVGGEFNNCTGNTINGGVLGFRLDGSQGNNIIANTIINAEASIWLYSQSCDNNISGNVFYNCGFRFYIFPGDNYLNNIDNTNLANGKPIYFYTDMSKLEPNNFTNAGQIILINCNHSIISNLNVSRCSVGISLHFCNNISISYVNSSYNSRIGFYLQNCNNITLWRIHAYDNQIGVEIDGGKSHNITENTMIKCGFGLNVYTIEEASSYTIDTTNKVNDGPVYFYISKVGLDSANFSNAGQILLVNVSDSIISDFEFSHCSQPISLHFCNNVTISNVSTSYCYYGIYASYSNHTIITGNNHMNHSGFGIFLGLCNNNTISGSDIVGNEKDGIYHYGDYIEISGNNIFNNDRNGIDIDGTYSMISGNKIFSNGKYGLESSSNYDIISGNNITYNNEDGMKLLTYESVISGNIISWNDKNGISLSNWSCNNTLTGNTICYNRKLGLELTDTTNLNYIFNNEFIGNFINAGDNGTGSYWDNGEIGNYWDDYAGVDANNDGIGDTPYTIQGTAGSQDNFPIWTDGDDLAPVITINFPLPNSIFGVDAPSFNISVDEINLDTIWYTLDGGITNYTTMSIIGTFNQAAWDALSESAVTIRFYANDTAGNISFIDVEVVKEISEDLPFISFGDYYLLFMVITIFSLIIRKRKKK